MRKSFLALLLFVFCAGLHAQKILPIHTFDRNALDLNGKWQYVIDQYETGQMGFMNIYGNFKPKDKTDRVEYDFDAAQSLWVPGGWNAQKAELQYYEGSIWYRKTFDKKDLDPNKRYFIRLDGANYMTTVTLNGRMVGKHEGGFTPFNYEVTRLLRREGNFLIVGVSNTRNNDNIPAKVTDWYNHGGITRGVSLVEVPKSFVSNFFIYLDKTTLTKIQKRIVANVHVQSATPGQSVQLLIPELSIQRNAVLDSTGKANFQVDASKLTLWSCENPKLYKVLVVCEGDTINDQVGFRTIETKGKQIVLNGKPIFLKGISLHDENPLRRDRANSMDDAKQMLGWVKELGCNFVRLAHYPHQENLVRLADQMGILLWEELPLYWGIDWGNDKVLQKAKDQYTELIYRDFNRASSIVWSIANETSPSPSRNKFLQSLIDHVRSLDPSRLLSAACKKDQAVDGHPDNDYTLGDPIMKYLDIISFNEYLGWYGGLPAECRKKTYKAQMEKPVIVSEFGGGALQGFYGDSLTRWSEDYQAYLYKENLAMFDRIDGLAGLTPWILCDFLSPLRQLPNVQDGWNRKGLISEKGKKKKAFFVLKNYYDNKKP